jgi:uncharacterized protein YecE (DUF72 family)
MSDARIRIGIGGWTYPDWRGLFYPPGLAQAKEQAYAASKFGAIEINSTFYSRQSPASWTKWAAAAPDGFKYAIKGSRFIVTRPKLADAGEGIGNFYAQGLEGLGDKLGPTLWTLARHRQFDADDMAAFLDLLPAKLGDLPLRHVIEPRHETFRDDKFATLCRDRDVAVAYGDDDEFPLLDLDTAEFRYARLQRMSDAIETGYNGQALDRFAALASEWQGKGRDGYIFLINGAKRRAPAAAFALQERLGISPA